MSEMTKLGADLIQAMTEALVHAQGKDASGIRVSAGDVGTVDAKAIRKKLDLTRTKWRVCLVQALPATRNGSKESGNPVALLEPCSGSWRKSRRGSCGLYRSTTRPKKIIPPRHLTEIRQGRGSFRGLQPRCLGEVDPKPISASLIATGHFSGGMAKLLLDKTLVYLSR